MNPTNEQLAMGHRWCIAGGWAACPQLANDQDLWIFVEINRDSDDVNDWLLSPYRDKILAAFPTIEPEYESRENKLYLWETGFDSMKVGRLRNRHILVTCAKDVQQLLTGFDISTHQCALTDDGEFVVGPGWTPITEPPKILKVGGPNTHNRFNKIASRYLPFYAAHAEQRAFVKDVTGAVHVATD